MSLATYIIIGIQVILCLVLIVVVLFQNGNQRGLSGSIAGGAETFFGKNKGRTIDAKLKKITAIIAVLFLLSSIALSFMVDKDSNSAASENQTSVEQQAPVTEGEVVPETENQAETPAE